MFYSDELQRRHVPARKHSLRAFESVAACGQASDSHPSEPCNLPRSESHPMGESKRKRMGALAKGDEAADQPQVVDTLGGRMHVRWEAGAAATPHRAMAAKSRVFCMTCPCLKFSGHAAAWLAMPLGASETTLETGDQQAWDRQMTDSSCSASFRCGRCGCRGCRGRAGHASEAQASLPARSVRSTYVPVRCCLGALGSDAVQLIQDAALVDRVRRTAACPQRLQLLFERAQLSDALRDMPDVLVQ